MFKKKLFYNIGTKYVKALSVISYYQFITARDIIIVLCFSRNFMVLGKSLE